MWILWCYILFAWCRPSPPFIICRLLSIISLLSHQAHRSSLPHPAFRHAMYLTKATNYQHRSVGFSLEKNLFQPAMYMRGLYLHALAPKQTRLRNVFIHLPTGLPCRKTEKENKVTKQEAVSWRCFPRGSNHAEMKLLQNSCIQIMADSSRWPLRGPNSVIVWL